MNLSDLDLSAFAEESVQSSPYSSPSSPSSCLLSSDQNFATKSGSMTARADIGGSRAVVSPRAPEPTPAAATTDSIDDAKKMKRSTSSNLLGAVAGAAYAGPSPFQFIESPWTHPV